MFLWLKAKLQKINLGSIEVDWVIVPDFGSYLY